MSPGQSCRGVAIVSECGRGNRAFECLFPPKPEPASQAKIATIRVAQSGQPLQQFPYCKSEGRQTGCTGRRPPHLKRPLFASQRSVAAVRRFPFFSWLSIRVAPAGRIAGNAGNSPPIVGPHLSAIMPAKARTTYRCAESASHAGINDKSNRSENYGARFDQPMDASLFCDCKNDGESDRRRRSKYSRKAVRVHQIAQNREFKETMTPPSAKRIQMSVSTGAWPSLPPVDFSGVSTGSVHDLSQI